MEQVENVYCVASGCYSDYEVHAAFECKEDAEAWASAISERDDNGYSRGDVRVQEFLRVPKGVKPYTQTTYHRNMNLWDDGTTSDDNQSCNTDFPICAYDGVPPGRPRVRFVRAPCHRGKGGRLEMTCANKSVMDKAFQDRLTMWKAGAWNTRDLKEWKSNSGAIDE